MSNTNALDIRVIVNGKLYVITGNVNTPLRTLIPAALEASESTGQPVENWELRDNNGELLDLSRKISSFGFTSETKLSLNLTAGVGGGSNA